MNIAKDEDYNDLCYDEIGTQKTSTNPCSKVNTIQMVYMIT